MKILIDMNLPPTLAELLTNAGIDAVHWYTLGKYDAIDDEIMAYARNHDYIVLTCDLDFNTILSVTHGVKPSVVLLRRTQIKAEQMINLLSSSIVLYSDALKNGAILIIDNKKARLRLLPL